MFKHFLKIILNRLKLSAIDTLTDVIMSSIAEFRRAKNEGAFDMHRDPYKDDLHRSNTNTQDINQPNH